MREEKNQGREGQSDEKAGAANKKSEKRKANIDHTRARRIQ